MSSHTRKIIVMLLCLSVLAALFACSGSTSRSLVVTVQSGEGNGLSNMVVVLGDKNGTMATWGETDSKGQVEFYNPPSNATVTVAGVTSYNGDTEPTSLFRIAYDVNNKITFDFGGGVPGPMRRRAPAPRALSTPIDPGVGTIVLNVSNSFPGVQTSDVYVNGYLVASGSVISQQTVTLYSYNFWSDPGVTIYAVGNDGNGIPIAYGSLGKTKFTSGMSVNISVDQPMSAVQYQVKNLPASALSLWPSLLGTTPFVPSNFYSSSWTAGQTSATVTVPYIPATGDQYYYSINVAYNLNNTQYWDSYQSLSFVGERGAAPQDQVFDFNEALALPSGLSVTGADTARPVISWNPVDTMAMTSYVTVYITRADGSTTAMMFSDLPLFRTSIRFPELPDVLADYRPRAVTAVSISLYANDGATSKSSNSTLMLQ